MGKGTNYIGTNKDMADKFGYSGTVSNPSYLCTHKRALGYGGYSPNYILGKDNYCIKYEEEFYTCGVNTSSNCTISISTKRTSAGQQIVATATAEIGYTMSSFTLQSDSGSIIQTVTTSPFIIQWTPNQNFKFSATATQITTYMLTYTTNSKEMINIDYASCFGASVLSHVFDSAANNWVVTFSTAPSFILENTYKDNTDLTSITLQNTITSIGDHAFSDCTSLTSINLPDSLTSIGMCAFNNCKELTSITLTNGIESIDNYAFNGCSGISTIDIPISIIQLGTNPFAGCSAITTMYVDLQNSIYEIRGNAIVQKNNNTLISGCANSSILSTVTSIAQSAFQDIDTLTTITIPSSVTDIGDSAFLNCNKLKSIKSLNVTPPILDGTSVFDLTNDCSIFVPYHSLELYKSTTNWDEYEDRMNTLPSIIYSSQDHNIVVPNASNLFGANIVSNVYQNDIGAISFDNGPTTIGIDAFQSCTTLATITIPDSVLTINGQAFEGCSNLTFVTIPNSVTSIGYAAFSYCTSLSSIIIPNSVTSIDGEAFNSCESLVSINIPSSVTMLGTNPFMACTGITTMTVDADNDVYEIRGNAIVQKSNNALISGCKDSTIYNTVTSIDAYAFCYLTSLLSLTIPSSVTSIGEYALYYCTGLTSITCQKTATTTSDVPTLGNNALTDTNNCPIYVPTNSLTSYQNATNWNNYQSRMIGI